jgi:hypothetical protein
VTGCLTIDVWCLRGVWSFWMFDDWRLVPERGVIIAGCLDDWRLVPERGVVIFGCLTIDVLYLRGVWSLLDVWRLTSCTWEGCGHCWMSDDWRLLHARWGTGPCTDDRLGQPGKFSLLTQNYFQNVEVAFLRQICKKIFPSGVGVGPEFIYGKIICSKTGRSLIRNPELYKKISD